MAIPHSAPISRTKGASAFVVQEALEITRFPAANAASSASSLAPSTTTASAALDGPDTSTRRAPADSPRPATSALSARPVHSITTSTADRSITDRSR
ncbi:hypothetical protein GALL_409430 [mine drainage metagenome]|uniref:Uncharacterized protein n=1 Tax=mine drainage metagenome TaxID=410659 RepID=A0A1J5Q0W6_9ZZZZ